jgi:hypothetical protein
MKVFRPYLTLIIVLLFSTQLFSAKPRLVSFNSLSDFERGKLDGISILTGGKLTISPKTVSLIDTGDPFVWDIAEDSNGNIFVATGNDGRIYKTNSNGDSTLFFDAKELQVFALEIDSKNNVYAATFPNGKVYKINKKGEGVEFFDPKTTYIWDLLLDAENNLYVATGQDAFVYKIDSKGNSSILLKSDQKHIRSLALGKKGTLYAGSSDKGYVYKISADEKPYVLHDTQKAEVHSLAISSDGETIYAAVYGSGGLVLPKPAAQAAPAKSGQASQNKSNQQDQSEVSLSPQSIVPNHIRIRPDQKTSLLLIDKNGYAKDIWTDNKHQVLEIIADEKNNLIVGTGKNGKVYKVDQEHNISLLFSVKETQVTALSKSGNSFLVGTSNMGRSYKVLSSFPEKASFESEAIDADNLSKWGTISWEGTATQDNVKFFTRAGNTEQPGETWSEWTAPTLDKSVYKINSPTARFVQWKCDLIDTTLLPIIDKVTLSYLQNNLAPEVTAVIIHKPGDYYSPQNKSNTKAKNKKGIMYPQPLTQNEYKKGYRSVDWLFQDPNFDGLVFDVFFKKAGNKHWKEMATKLESSVYSWDSSLMEDGTYLIQVLAKDSPSNPDKRALFHKKQSNQFDIDNSGPNVETLQEKDKININISDQFSIIKSFHYSIDAGDYFEMYPNDGINDSKIESYSVKLPKGGQGETQLTIRAIDYLDNVTVKHVNVN